MCMFCSFCPFVLFLLAIVLFVLPSSIYGFWLPLCYLQSLLVLDAHALRWTAFFFIHVDISLYTDKLSWLLANYSESYLLMLCVWPDQELKLLSSTWVEITLEAGCTNHPGGRGLWYNMFYTEISKTEVSSSWTYMDGNSTPSYSHLMPNGSRTDLWLSIMKVRRYKDVIKIIVHQDRKTKT